jgi:hypothetical protein
MGQSNNTMKKTGIARRSAPYALGVVAAGAAIAWWNRQQARAGLDRMLGRMDERWYWFCQDMLCRLGEDPKKADRMYEPAKRMSCFPPCPPQDAGFDNPRHAGTEGA